VDRSRKKIAGVNEHQHHWRLGWIFTFCYNFGCIILFFANFNFGTKLRFMTPLFDKRLATFGRASISNALFLNFATNFQSVQAGKHTVRFIVR